MFHEVSMAILPSHSLAETLGDWDEIAEQLAEPSRKRLRYAFSYVNAYWGAPQSAVLSKTSPSAFNRWSEQLVSPRLYSRASAFARAIIRDSSSGFHSTGGSRIPGACGRRSMAARKVGIM